MRVVVVSAWEPWLLTDGAVWVLHHHLRWLADRHEITVLSAGAPAVEAPVPQSVRTLPEGVPVRWFGAGRRPALDRAARMLTARRTGEPAHVHYVERAALIDALKSELSRQRPDVVHAFGWGTAGVWRHAAGVPVVHVAVDAWHRNLANRMLPAWRVPLERGQARVVTAHERRHYPHAAAVVVVAERDAEVLRRLVPDARIEVVPNGVDVPGEPATAPTAALLGFHGTFDARHNVDAARVLARTVLPAVRAEVPEVRLRLVGRNPGRDVLALSGPSVEVRANVADIWAELRDVGVYVAPLVSGWGMKNKVLEAMAAGRPVVTTPAGAAGIGAGPGLIVVPAVEDIPRAVVALLRDPSKMREMGAAGRARVSAEFGWNRSAAAIEGLWREVAGG